ncbi:TPA: hypothetical protein I7716_07295 [Vibrio vulnificus]|nr:hypothetical protein [Vibrio vulnificus]HAS8495176.1 hypothetical protein [Vibrio vulnificus]
MCLQETSTQLFKSAPFSRGAFLLYAIRDYLSFLLLMAKLILINKRGLEMCVKSLPNYTHNYTQNHQMQKKA